LGFFFANLQRDAKNPTLFVVLEPGLGVVLVPVVGVLLVVVLDVVLEDVPGVVAVPLFATLKNVKTSV
jgi:hypothetical protein